MKVLARSIDNLLILLENARKMNQSNMSLLSDMDIIDHMNHKTAQLLIPAMIYTVILMLVGLVGNPLAIYIYGWRWEITTTRNFLLCLSVIDLFNCLSTMPIEILLILKFYYFNSGHLCKMSRFTTYVMNNTTSMILVFIAVDRYIRICRKRTRQLDSRTAFVGCIIALIAGVSVSWPALIIYGRREFVIPLKDRNVTGVMCLVESSYKDTIYPFAFFLYLWIGVTVTGLIIVVLYTFIGKEVYRRKTEKKAKMKLVQDTLKRLQAKRRSASTTSVLNGVTASVDSDKLCPVTVNCTPKLKPGKSTLMLFAIAVVYLLSFIPFLIVITVRTVRGEGFYGNLNTTEQVVVNIFIRSYLFNNCVNPIVYGLCNSQFRREVANIYYRFLKRSDDLNRSSSVGANASR